VAAGLEVSEVVYYQSAKRAQARREQSFQVWLTEHPIAESRVTAHLSSFRATADPGEGDVMLRVYLSGTREKYIRRLPGGTWKVREGLDEGTARWIAREELESELRWAHAQQTGTEDVVNTVGPLRSWWDWPLWRLVVVSAGVATGLTALPWGVFYLLRWIVQGFLP
jgi:hypothetical protein